MLYQYVMHDSRPECLIFSRRADRIDGVIVSDNGSSFRQILYLLMYDLSQSNQYPNESQIYEDLSFFLQIFKRSLNLVQKITIHLQQKNDHIIYLHMIKKVLEELEPLIEKYSSIAQQINIEETTYHRFISRLFEIINLYKQKYQNALNSSYFCHAIGIFINFLKETELILKKNEIDRTLFSLMKLINTAIVKFCFNCKKNESPSDEKHEELIISLKRLNEKVHVKVEPAKKTKRSIKQIQDDEQYQESQKQLMINTIHSQAIILNKNINNIYNQFITQKSISSHHSSQIPYTNRPLQKLGNNFAMLNALDLDVGHLKTSYMQGKNNQKEYYNDCMQRNEQILNSMANYNRLFTRYRKREELKSIKKLNNSIINHYNNNTINKSYQFKERVINRQSQLNDSLEHKVKYTIDQPTKLSQLKVSQIVCESQQKIKKAYRLNNVYLSLDKNIKGSKDDKLDTKSRVALNKSQHQANKAQYQSSKSNRSTNINKLYKRNVALENSYMTSSHIQQGNSISVIHSKLKIVPEKHKTAAEIRREQMLLNRREVYHTQSSLEKEEQFMHTNIPAFPIKEEKSKRALNLHYKKSNKSSQLNLSSARTNLKFTIRSINTTDKQKSNIIISTKPF